MTPPVFSTWPIWGRWVRAFHAINLVLVLVMLGLGVVMLCDELLGIPNEGKVVLKDAHVYVGYLFALNVLLRLIWAVIGPPHARFAAFLPFYRGFGRECLAYLRTLRGGPALHYAGHNPLARLAISAFFLLLISQALTGLVLASAYYKAPFGAQVKAYIAAEPQLIEQIRPYSMEGIDPVAYARMRELRKPFKQSHVYGFWILLLLIPVHIAGAIHSELRERNRVISAMVTGEKVFQTPPVDAERFPPQS